MKFDQIKKMLDNKYNIEEIKKAINSVAPTDLKRKMKGKKKDENLIIKIIKSKLA